MQNRKPSHQTRKPKLIRRNIRLKIAFDGTAYHGWQIQKDAPTIQGSVSAALSKITGEPVSLTGSGRTDSGTHARGLVANFLSESTLPLHQLVRAANSLLPRDIRILSAGKVPQDFHARKSAISKTYRYQIYRGGILPPHLLRECFHFPYPIDISKMKAAADLFLGEHDFASYAKSNSAPANTIRRIFRCDLQEKGSKLLLTVTGNGFLHHMVRNMAGTLLEVGQGTIGLENFADLFNKRDRNLAGFTAPAQGLILLKVQY
jgi:tRNA pseudouridine38-40 synthase